MNCVEKTTEEGGTEDTVQSLFRIEVMTASSSEVIGAIRLTQPISALLTSVLSLFIIVCLFLYVLLGSVTKKARVSGITIPVEGTLSLISPTAGVLTRSYVVEGQKVEAGQTLFELSTERENSSGELTALISKQLNIRSQTLDSEKKMRIAEVEEKKKVVKSRIVNLDQEYENLNEEIILAERRKNLALKSLTDFKLLESSGFMSSAQTQQKQADLIEYESKLKSLQRTKVQLQANKINLQSEYRAAETDLAASINQIDLSLASLNQEVAENQNRRVNLIKAPQQGVVTGINYQLGQAVSAGQALGTIIRTAEGGHGNNMDLEVHLYAPSRTAGFVAQGQQVLLRYQAYPYQKFGLQEGIVTNVSKTPFAPNELPANIVGTVLSNAQQTFTGAGSNEALYRIKVKIKKQSIFAYDQEQLLKPGMTLDADIIQDKRKIWEWIAEPILAVAHH